MTCMAAAGTVANLHSHRYGNPQQLLATFADLFPGSLPADGDIHQGKRGFCMGRQIFNAQCLSDTTLTCTSAGDNAGNETSAIDGECVLLAAVTVSCAVEHGSAGIGTVTATLAGIGSYASPGGPGITGGSSVAGNTATVAIARRILAAVDPCPGLPAGHGMIARTVAHHDTPPLIGRLA